MARAGLSTTSWLFWASIVKFLSELRATHFTPQILFYLKIQVAHKTQHSSNRERSHYFLKGKCHRRPPLQLQQPRQLPSFPRQITTPCPVSPSRPFSAPAATPSSTRLLCVRRTNLATARSGDDAPTATRRRTTHHRVPAISAAMRLGPVSIGSKASKRFSFTRSPFHPFSLVSFFIQDSLGTETRTDYP